MFLDAFAAERFRLLRDRGAVFWGFLFPAIGGLLITLVVTMLGQLVSKDVGAGRKLDALVSLGDAMTGSISGTSSPITQLFLVLAAAAIFASDYRWETWRLQVTRNSRLQIMLAKVAAYAVGVVVAVVLLAISGLIGALLRAAIEGFGIAPFDFKVWIGPFARGAAASVLELMLIGGIAAILAVATRSSMASVIVPVLLVVGQAIMIGVMRINPLAPPFETLAIPGVAADVIRGVEVGPARVTAEGAGPAAVFMVLWIGLTYAAAIGLFERQELSRE